MNFAGVQLDESIKKGIEEMGFNDWTPVQAKTLELSLSGKDICVQSKTGTGKTAAFLVTIYQLFKDPERFKNKKALILTPTRELAVQIENEANVLGKYCEFKYGCFYGGVSYFHQEKKLEEGVNLYIGTPGRLIDFYKSKKIRFSDMDVVVIDEADRMFDMGFIKDLQYILRNCRPPQKRITLLFSATLNSHVKRLAWDLMNNPEEVEIEPESLTVDKVKQEIYHVSTIDKFKLLLGLLKKINPKNFLMFTNTKRQAEHIAARLTGNNYPTEFISGDLPQKKRLKLIEDVKAGTIRFIVATDVAARGLHIDDLEMVINYDIPEDPSSYVHRIGRTARAGKEGLAISLVDEHSIYNLDPIEKKVGFKLQETDFEKDLLVEDIAKPVFKKKPVMTHAKGHPIKSDNTRTHRHKPQYVEKPASVMNNTAEAAHVSQKSPAASTAVPAAQIKPKPIRAALPAQVNQKEFKKQPTPQPRKTVNSGQTVKPSKSFKRDPDLEREIVYNDSIRVSRNLPLKERIKLYEKKYGKDFIPKRGGILGKILSFFTGKK